MSLPEEVRKYLSSLGKRGGASKSAAKLAAAAANGRKGGRPKKVSTGAS